MERVITDDGSITFYNEQAGDHYHTKSGAVEEARIKHVDALDVKPGKVIFDVCFGLGYNTAAALERGPETIYCFENDKEILKKILEIDVELATFGLIKDFVKGFLEGEDTYEKEGIKLAMFFGDARQLIDEVPERADYVFFDPFSPAKVPEMWSEDFFKVIFDKMNPGARLSTYSCARWVRDNMRKAGFVVEDGPVLGRRSPSTIGIKKGT